MNRIVRVLPVILLAGLAISGCRRKQTPPPPPPATMPATASAPAPVAPVPASEPLTVASRSDAGHGVTVATLSNGLRVIVKPHRSLPIVCVKSYVHTGGMHEGQWLGAGLSHLCEHLVAEDATHDGASSKKDSADEGDNRVTAIGGQSNASTSRDWTQYYISASSSKTDQCIDLIADWMAHPQITRAAFEREHEVVQRELERSIDDPNRQLWQTHSADLYRGHPAAVPVIGYAAPLAALTYQDVLDYVRIKYVPQNMIFCVVGDVDTEAVIDRVCAAFAGTRRERTPETSLPPVEPLTGVRQSVLHHKDVTQVTEVMSFQTIPLVHEDLYALDVLSYVLTQGESSRMSRSLVREKQLVTSVGSYSWTPSWGTGEFAVTFRCEPEKLAAARRAVMTELAAVCGVPVSDEELARAKRQKVADYVYSQQTVNDIADTLARDLLATGDVAFSRDYTRKIQSVTREQVLTAARKYFTFDRMVITQQLPAKAHAASGPAPGPVEAKAKAAIFTLPNGTQVVLQPDDSVALVAMTYVVKGGLLAETDATNALGSLMASLSTAGAGSRSSQEISAFFDAAGGGISGSGGNNTFYWRATILDDQFPTALEIFSDVVLRPHLDAKELEIIRPRQVAAIKAVDENWQSQFHRFFREKFYADGPYSRLPIGRLDVVESATPEALCEFHQRYVVNAPGVLSICGQFDAAKTRAAIEKLFAVEMPEHPWAPPETAPRKIAPEGELHVLKTTNQAAGVIVALPGMTLTNPDRFAIDVLDTIISGYQLPTGWLHNELRGKGLVYFVHAYNWDGLQPGAFMIEAQCQPEKVPEVLAIIRKNLAKAVEYTPSQAEVDRAVNVILTARLLDGQEMSALSMDAGLNQLYGLGYDYRTRLEGNYRKVTPADVNAVARKYLTRPQVVVVSTSKPEVLEPKGK